MLRDLHWQLSPESSTAQPSSNSLPSAAALELFWGSWCSGLLIHIQKRPLQVVPISDFARGPHKARD